MKLGIIQGRLSQPIEGFQECPNDWKREFDLLPSLGLNHIEWIVTKKSFGNNPLFNEDLSPYSISSICADHLVDSDIIQPSFLKQNLEPICDIATLNNITTITIPLLEDSDMINDAVRSSFINEIRSYGVAYPHLIFSFEIESYEHVIREILDICPNFRLTYDTGNMTSLGINHIYYLQKFFNKIDNIHLKDRTFNKETVVPTTGDTQFNKIFKYLRSNKYSGVYTLQTAREYSGKETQTINNHKQKLINIYEKSI